MNDKKIEKLIEAGKTDSEIVKIMSEESSNKKNLSEYGVRASKLTETVDKEEVIKKLVNAWHEVVNSELDAMNPELDEDVEFNKEIFEDAIKQIQKIYLIGNKRKTKAFWRKEDMYDFEDANKIKEEILRDIKEFNETSENEKAKIEFLPVTTEEKKEDLN